MTEELRFVQTASELQRMRDTWVDEERQRCAALAQDFADIALSEGMIDAAERLEQLRSAVLGVFAIPREMVQGQADGLPPIRERSDEEDMARMLGARGYGRD